MLKYKKGDLLMSSINDIFIIEEIINDFYFVRWLDNNTVNRYSSKIINSNCRPANKTEILLYA